MSETAEPKYVHGDKIYYHPYGTTVITCGVIVGLPRITGEGYVYMVEHEGLLSHRMILESDIV